MLRFRLGVGVGGRCALRAAARSGEGGRGARDPAVPGCQAEGTGQDDVHVANPASAEPLTLAACVSPFSQAGVEAVERAHVHLGDRKTAKCRLDAVLDQRAVVVQGPGGDRLPVVDAPGQPLIEQFRRSVGGFRAMETVGDLDQKAAFDLLGVLPGPVDLPTDAAFLACEWIGPRVDPDLPALAASSNYVRCAPVRGHVSAAPVTTR